MYTVVVVVIDVVEVVEVVDVDDGLIVVVVVEVVVEVVCAAEYEGGTYVDPHILIRLLYLPVLTSTM